MDASAARLVSCLMCHAPIVAPEIAGDRAGQVAATTSAMRQAARAMIAASPQLCIIVSPHTPRLPDAFALLGETACAGDFAAFGFPQLRVKTAGAPEAAMRLTRLAARDSLPVRNLGSSKMDHGALVPLHFLCEAGWSGPTLILGLRMHAVAEELLELGRTLRRLQEELNQPLCLIASGDMSHRLKPGAPAGFDPQAEQFDLAVCRALERGDLSGAVHVDAQLRQLAGEDVIDSLTVALGACDAMQEGRVLSYEGPFGVGYLIAILKTAAAGK
ncbi:MAG: hypothetical protein K1X75_13475 [Leptospirales bacterium]|nr:hypothetical protein [Leptospirales bacterium]